MCFKMGEIIGFAHQTGLNGVESERTVVGGVFLTAGQ